MRISKASALTLSRRLTWKRSGRDNPPASSSAEEGVKHDDQPSNQNITWREVDWNGPRRVFRDEDDYDQVDPLTVSLRPWPGVPEEPRRASPESQRSEANAIAGGTLRSATRPRVSPRLWAGLRRLIPWRRRKPSQQPAEPAHRTASPSASDPRNGDDKTGPQESRVAQRRGATTRVLQTKGPKSECWWQS